MRLPVLCMAVLTYVVIGPTPAVAQVDQRPAQEYFKEAQALCERDGGRMWGVSLCGPMVIADPVTGTIATSQPAPTGDRPRGIGFLNAPVQWGGTTWAGLQLAGAHPRQPGRAWTDVDARAVSWPRAASPWAEAFRS
jgi:hypothetical protein